MKTIKSAWPENANIHRAASRGKLFTRRERENLISHQHATGTRLGLIQEEREKIKTEKEERHQRMRVIRAMSKHPDQKIRRKKDGSAYIQRQVNGKFQKAEVVA